MKSAEPTPPDSTEEIASLVAMLLRGEQRLEELTGGSKDLAGDGDERRHLLRRAEDALRQNEAGNQAAILDALPAHIALLDAQGIIVSVNEVWRRFGLANELGDPRYGVGVDYLDVCDRVRGADSFDAREAAAGIRSVLSGTAPRFLIEYPCHSPTEQRWFLLTVTPLSEDRPNGVVVMHLNVTERRRAEDALTKLSRQTEQRERVLSTTLSSISDFAYIFDKEGRFLFANQPLLNLLRIPLEALVGRTLFELNYPEELASRLQRQIQEVFQTKRSITDETAYSTRAVPEGFYEYIFSPVIAADGTVEFVVGSTRDVTERKQSAEALRRSEREQRQLAGQLEAERSRLVSAQRVAKIGSWETDLTTMSVIWSEEVHRICETDPAAFQPTHEGFLDFVHPEERAMVDAALGHSLDLGGGSIEHRVLLPDGRIKFVEERWQILCEAGKPVRAIGTCQNITERNKAAEQLRLQSAALNAADNAMLITDRDLSIVWVNPAFTELTGYPAYEAVGRNAQDLLHSGLHDRSVDQDIRDTILAGESWSGEMTNRRKDGGLYQESQTVTPVKGGDGVVSHFISIKTDLTAQHRLEAQLRQSQKMEAVGQLAAGVAHEFNNLLQALMSMATITRLRAGTADVATIASEMELQIRHGATITQQLLLFSRHHSIETKELDLREQAHQASVLLRRLIPETIRIIVESAPEPCLVAGDAGQMQQVLLNLAINARDAMPAGGLLTLRAGCAAGEAFLEVEDTGHGLDEKTRARIFEPFFTTKDAGTGSGLGLAVVHGIVQQHGGRIEVLSRVDEGSCFRVILPALVSESTPLRELAAAVEVPMGSGRVLLVEDEEGVRAGLAVLLEMTGYAVTAVSSGEEALALPVASTQDVLLSDLTLPGITGLELGERLRERWPALQVVLMSGYIDEAVRGRASERGWHFLQKPFEMTELASCLHAALGGRSRTEN